MNGLFGSTALEIALGLVFIFFLLSVVCSSINEFFAGLLKWRARDLELGLKNLLRDPQKVEQLFNHPLVRSLSSGRSEAFLVRTLAGTGPAGRVVKDFGAKPSYIDPRTFALALLDVVTPDNAQPITIETICTGATALANSQDNDQAQQTASRELGKLLLLFVNNAGAQVQMTVTLGDVVALVQDLPDSGQKEQVLQALQAAQSLAGANTALLALPATEARNAALSLLNRAQTDIQAVRTRAMLQQLERLKMEAQ